MKRLGQYFAKRIDEHVYQQAERVAREIEQESGIRVKVSRLEDQRHTVAIYPASHEDDLKARQQEFIEGRKIWQKKRQSL